MKKLLFSLAFISSISAIAGVENEIREWVSVLDKKTGVGTYIKNGVKLSEGETCSIDLYDTWEGEFPISDVVVYVGKNKTRVNIAFWDEVLAKKRRFEGKTVYELKDWGVNGCKFHETIVFTKKSVLLTKQTTSCRASSKNKTESMTCKY